MSEPKETAKAIQAAVEIDVKEFSKKISYLVGNARLKILNVKKEIMEKVIGGSKTLQGCYSIGANAWKNVEDISRGYKVCAGLCIVATKYYINYYGKTRLATR
jgi:hypothetical protein